jgi:hypothetical protein
MIVVAASARPDHHTKPGDPTHATLIATALRCRVRCHRGSPLHLVFKVGVKATATQSISLNICLPGSTIAVLSVCVVNPSAVFGSDVKTI